MAPWILWETRTDKAPTTLVDWRVRGGSVSFSHDGEVLASGGADNVVHLLDVATGQELGSLRGHQEGHLLVSVGTKDGTVRLWDLTCTPPRSREIRLFPPSHTFSTASP